ncbi:MAG TPA: ribonuclease P protein component [Segetibacter sp.]|nr:ribonuclease P protein component [Segetibacter sp.]
MSFNKAEKLKSRKLIENLFREGKSVSVFPIKVLYGFVENLEVPLQAGVTASSRRFKKAVERNRIKRIMREAYRLQKSPLQQLLSDKHKSLVLFFIYLDRELPLFAEVHQKMGVVLQKLVDHILKQPD